MSNVPDCPDCDCAVAVGCCPGRKIPRRLYLHGPNGLVTLNYVADLPSYFVPEAGIHTPAGPGWIGLSSVAVPDGASAGWDPVTFVCLPGIDHEEIGPVSAGVRYHLTCNESGFWSLFVFSRGCYIDLFSQVPLDWDPADMENYTFGNTATASDCPPTCSPLVLPFTHHNQPGDTTPLRRIWGEVNPASLLITEAPTPPSVTANACITARTCAYPDGDLVPDCEVVLRKVDGTEVGTATTGVDGRACIAVTAVGDYLATVTDPYGCVAVVAIGITPCSTGDVEAEAVFCCATKCFEVLDDQSTEMAPIPIADAVVTIQGLGSATTDAEGKAYFELTPEYLKYLPAAGGDCRVRQLPAVTVSKEGAYLERCDDEVTVECDEDGSTPHTIRMTALGTSHLVPEAICPDDCSAEGLVGRNVVPPQVGLQPSAEVDGESEPYSVLGDQEGVLQVLGLDTGLLDTGVSTHSSPWGDGTPDVEYFGQGTGSFNPPGCATPYTDWKAWLRRGQGLIWEWYGPSYTSSQEGDCPPADTPGTVPPACATCLGNGYGRRYRITMAGDPGFCLPVAVDFSATVGGGGGDTRDFRYHVEALEYLPP